MKTTYEFKVREYGKGWEESNVLGSVSFSHAEVPLSEAPLVAAYDFAHNLSQLYGKEIRFNETGSYQGHYACVNLYRKEFNGEIENDNHQD